MKSFKKVLTMAGSLVLTAAIAVGATVAYLQDDDSDVNVMTLGNVKIEQHEYERATNEDGTYKTDTIGGQTSYVLKDFTQGKPLLPCTELDANGNPYNYGAGDYGPTRVKMSQVGSHGSMDVFVNENAIDKFVTVENTGKTDAYVRTIIAYEVGSVANFRDVINTSSFMTAQGVWKVTDIGVVEIDGNNYYVSEYIYEGAKDLGGVHENGVLPAGDTTYPSLAQVYMKATATNEDVEKIDGNKNGTYDILVLSQAVQTAGFENAQTALDTAFGKTADKAAEWFGGKDFDIPTVADKDNIDDALANDDNIVLGDDVQKPANNSNSYGKTGITVKAGQVVDGNGKTFGATDAGSTWDSAINATGGTIKNLTIDKGFRGIFVNHNAPADECGLVTLENVVIDGPTYTISCDQGTNNGLKAINSTFNGWTSYAGTLGTAKFENCKFGEGAGYSFCRPYAPTEFVGCDFEAGYRLDARAMVTFEDCTIGGQPLTSANLSTLVIGNIANASVK